MPKSGTTIPRLVPDAPFPAYAYVPGKFPHPTRRDAGPSNSNSALALAQLDPEHWPHCREYLWGIDLFNHGYYWEAHEAWENLWHAAGRRGPVAEFLKSLIALAAAGVKAREGRLAGVRQHARRAQSIFAELLEQPEIKQKNHFAGLNLSDLIEAAKAIADAPEKVLNPKDRAVEIVFAFVLLTLRRG